MTAALMFQGTGSNVGKSLLVAGYCRLFARRGLKVRPFKPQNMSNNAAATADGGEIGRAQALQARACGLDPHTDFNPVLLKPETDIGAQVIVHGRRVDTWQASVFRARRGELLSAVLESWHRLSADADLILVEGAGSPAETNLRAGDIANMGFAEAADIPVALIGDIDKGGVIASLVGTHAVIAPSERTRIRAFLINKFRGDVTLFDEGLAEIERRTGWTSAGVVPWFGRAGDLPEEDTPRRPPFARPTGDAIRISVPVFGRMANFDDLDPLRMERAVDLIMLTPGETLPPETDVVLLPGSKSTIADLAFLRAQGWDIDILAHRRRGGLVIGLCGGYQILGRAIADPDGIEGQAGTVAGLGLLDMETVLTPDKTVRPVTGRHLESGEPVTGYEIHLGRSEGPDCARPQLDLDGRPDGAASSDGRVWGTYVHGLFASDPFRRRFLDRLGGSSDLAYERRVDDALDALADHLEAHSDADALLDIAMNYRKNATASTA